jgi:hypothetical protein
MVLLELGFFWVASTGQRAFFDGCVLFLYPSKLMLPVGEWRIELDSRELVRIR